MFVSIRACADAHIYAYDRRHHSPALRVYIFVSDETETVGKAFQSAISAGLCQDDRLRVVIGPHTQLSRPSAVVNHAVKTVVHEINRLFKQLVGGTRSTGVDSSAGPKGLLISLLKSRALPASVAEVCLPLPVAVPDKSELRNEGVENIIAVRPPNMNADKNDPIRDLSSAKHLLAKSYSSVLDAWSASWERQQ